MRNTPGPHLGKSIACLTAAWLLAAAAPAVANAGAEDPPPFLPRELADVVERARAKQRAETPQRTHDAPAEIDEVASGELTLREVVGMLSSSSYDDRETATRLLADVPQWDDQTLSLVCARAELCPEARARIREALFTRFANSPGPAVGIQMDQNRAEPGVGIAEVMPRFPAARTLRKGDVILKIGDIDLRADPTPSRLQEVVASYQPGDRVDVLILRDSREQLVQVELGRFENLNEGMGMRNETLLRQAWSIRARRLGLEEVAGEPVAVAISMFDWRRATQRGGQARPASGMAPGGEPAIVPGRLPGVMANLDNSRITRVERVDRADVRVGHAPRGADVQKALEDRLSEVETMIGEMSERLADARTPQQELPKLRSALEELSTQRRQILLEMVRWADRND